MAEIPHHHPLSQPEPWSLQERPLTPEQVEMLKPEHAALLIIDAQKAYADPDEVLAKDIAKSTTHNLDQMSQMLPSFIAHARTTGLPIIWTRMTEDPKFMSKNYQTKMKIDDVPAISTPDTHGFEYIGEGLDDSDMRHQIKPQSQDKEIIKSTYSALKKTDLDKYLKENGISTLVIVGAYASRCVLFTAADAADSEYDVFVIRDLVANLDQDDFEQQPTLSTISSIAGYIPYSRQVSEVWNNLTH